jgi:hypothetical protein
MTGSKHVSCMNISLLEMWLGYWRVAVNPNLGGWGNFAQL